MAAHIPQEVAAAAAGEQGQGGAPPRRLLRPGLRLVQVLCAKTAYALTLTLNPWHCTPVHPLDPADVHPLDPLYTPAPLVHPCTHCTPLHPLYTPVHPANYTPAYCNPVTAPVVLSVM